MGECSQILLIILAIFLPPVAVFLKRGCGVDLLINIILYILTASLLAIIHALYVVFQ
ncbi:hypothetical protein AKO1_010480 [Acrasis kona]|uniref:Plasma membrane proteolipid 3 n=1 Tax=Acrasis kona TaxID=1008807 RepID=A0AAW2ZJD1_9EUKA